MPDEKLRQRFEAIIQGATELWVRCYLEEAHKCFVAEAYNGAVVMTWTAVAAYIRQVVEQISVDYFRYNYKVAHSQEPLPDLARINDNLFIQACDRAGILCDVIPTLNRLRERRNDCAHPTGIFVSPEETLELAESVSNVLSRRVTDEQLTDPAILREFARIADQRDGEAIALWVREELCPQLTHDLLTIFERDDEIEGISGIIGLWQGLWSRIDDPTRQRLWDRIERMVPAILFDENRSLRTPEELVRLIVWPDPEDEHPSRDRIAQLFVEWLEQLAQSGQFTSADMELARELRRHLPPPFRERLRAALQEMTRRYTE